MRVGAAELVERHFGLATQLASRYTDATETSPIPTSIKQLREVEEISWVTMQNGKPYLGDLYIKKIEHPEYIYPDGADGIYTTLTAAVADLNLRGVSGPVNFLLTDNIYTTGETYPIIINIQNVSLPTAVNKVTIKPNTGISALIQGSSTNSQIIRINNSYVGIDGSNSGGTGRNLTIENTNTTTPQVIGISSLGTTPLVGAFVKNCNIINRTERNITADV